MSHIKLRKLSLSLALVSCLILTGGCWSKTRIVMQGEGSPGSARVAQNEKIAVIIVGQDGVDKKDMGGYNLIHNRDLKRMLKSVEYEEKHTKKTK